MHFQGRCVFVFFGMILASSTYAVSSTELTTAATPRRPRLSRKDASKSSSIIQSEATDCESFNIALINIGSAVSETFLYSLRQATNKWMSVIKCGLPDFPFNISLSAGECRVSSLTIVPPTDDLTVLYSVGPIDGERGGLAFAGTCLLRSTSMLPILGHIRVDEDDVQLMVDKGILTDVITHEIGHIIGFSEFIFRQKGLILNPSNTTHMLDSVFTGSNATDTFDTIGGAQYIRGAKVPLENMYGAGSMNSHWRESVFGTELMSPFIVSAGNPLSVTTIGLLADLGYVVNYSAADAFLLPELSHSTLHLASDVTYVGDDCFTGPSSMIPPSAILVPSSDDMHTVDVALF